MRKTILQTALTCLIIAFALRAAFAQVPTKIEHYSTEDGLSHDFITCMFKDHEGFMWFGTWDGVNRFDGHNFKTYKSVPGDRSQLKNNRIDQITEDNNNNLWLKGYDGQIYRFNKATEQFTSLASILKIKEKIVFDRILSTSNGMLWVSTMGSGLILVPDLRNKPDLFVNYKQNGKPGYRLPSEDINFFYRDNQLNIWIGTAAGLVRLGKNHAGMYATQALPIHNGENFTSVAEGNNGLYFGTATGQLVNYQKSGKFFNSPILISKGRLNGLRVSHQQNRLYITTSAGELVFFDLHNSHLQRFIHNPAMPLKNIFEDKNENLWLEPAKEGIVRFDARKKTFKTYTQHTDAKFNNPGNHFKVYEDRDGVVWTILRDGGFGYYNAATDKIAYFYNEPGNREHRFSNIVTVALYDPAGVLWLHTDTRGLEKVIFQPGDFKQHLLVDPAMFKSDNEVRSLFYDHQDRLWLGVKSGQLYVYKNGLQVRDIFVNPPKEGLGSVYTILQDSNGSLWLGTKANGLYRADPVNNLQTRYRLTHFQHEAGNPASLCSNEIYALLQDRQNRIWIGSFDKGLDLLISQNGTTAFKHISGAKEGYPARFSKIRHMALDKKGQLWLGTTDGLVVAKINGSSKFQFSTYSKQPGDTSSLGNNDIQYIYRDASNNMWLATSGGGLNMAITGARSTPIKFRAFTTKQQLANDYILSCTEDRLHHLWITTKSSLSCFDPKTKKFKNYNTSDGLPNSTFSEACCQKLANGQLAFGTIHGYLTFDPDLIKNYPISANMVFTNLQINNNDVDNSVGQQIMDKNIDYIHGLKLKYDQNTISLDYTVLDYRSGNHQSYRHRLIGADPIWHDNKNQRRATYTNLPPGQYIFEVKSINKEDYLHAPSKQLTITILPPPWRTWWAYLLYTIIAAVILETVRRTVFTMLRLRQKIAVEQQLTELKLQFFTNMSHELRTPLTLILNPAEEILKGEQLTPQGQEYFAIVRRNAGRMARFVNQLLDLRKVQSKKATLNPSTVELVSFITDIGKYFKEAAKEKHIKFTVQADDELIYAWLDAEKIETVIYNLLSNSYKFTPAGKEITVFISKDSATNTIKIKVNDEGCGVLPEELTSVFELYHEGAHPDTHNLKGSGIGLALSKELIGLHNGNIIAANLPGGGFSVTVQLPAGNPQSANFPLTQTPVTGMVSIDEQKPQADQLPGNVQADKPLVLLVEDNMDMRIFLARQLGAMYRVALAENGEKGLKKAQQLQPDLILSDVMMPEMDGIEMLHHLKKEVLTSHIPVVLLSAKSAIENQIKGLKYGADYYITKPFENDFLFAAVANILEKRKQFAAHISSGKTIVSLNPGEVIVTSKDELFLKKVIAVIEEKMTDPDFNIDAVAEVINMSRAAFFNKFKSLTQLAPVEFVREMRLKRAKQYLDAGAGNITEIAYQTGFSSAKYFSTCFKAQYHISPSDYLKTTKTIACSAL